MIRSGGSKEVRILLLKGQVLWSNNRSTEPVSYWLSGDVRARGKDWVVGIVTGWHDGSAFAGSRGSWGAYM